MITSDLLVVGGGAAGLMAACAAAETGASVTVLERRERPARKILVTGKGRCNLTNNCDNDTLVANVPRGGRFLYAAFADFSAADTIAFFESRGVPLETQRGNRVFPTSMKAMDIADALVAAAKKAGVHILEERVTALEAGQTGITGVICEGGNRFAADRIILATGGLSYPGTGSTGDGYILAKQVGHTITECVPSLIPLESDDDCAAMQGVSLRNVGITVTAAGKKKAVYTDFGELLFTHFGISGPTVLSASAHLNRPESGDYTFHIDLKPALDTATLDARLLREFAAAPNKDIIHATEPLLPRKMVPVVLQRAGLPFQQKVHQVTKAQRSALLDTLKNFTIHISGTRPIAEAVITRGGVSLKEVHPGTMESKLCPGLYFAGELLDVDAYTGGFNLQIAFSTGHLAGKSAGERNKTL